MSDARPFCGGCYLMYGFKSRSYFSRAFALLKSRTRSLVTFCRMKEAMQAAWGITAEPSQSNLAARDLNESSSAFVAFSWFCLLLFLSSGMGFIFYRKFYIFMCIVPCRSWDISHPFNWMSSSRMNFLSLYRLESCSEKSVMTGIDPAIRTYRLWLWQRS